MRAGTIRSCTRLLAGGVKCMDAVRRKTAGKPREHFRRDAAAPRPWPWAAATAATARDYGTTGPVFGDEVAPGLGGTRRTQRIRSPSRSRRGSTPKLF